MDILPHNSILNNIQPDEVVDYLHLRGWQETLTKRAGWRVFTGDADDEGRPFEVVIPKKRSPENDLFLANSLNLLSEIADEDPQTIVQRVKYRHQDVLQILDSTGDDSIPLATAAKQINAMKSLVGFGALSEQNARPYYPRMEGTAVTRTLRNYRFEHTLRGSFGFAIAARVVEEPRRYVQTRMFDNSDTAELVIAPIERRVMERIVRGLRDVVEATRKHAPEELAQYYPGGFNSNMCTSVVAMSAQKEYLLTYRVLWSPRMPPSQDVESTRQIRIGRLEYSSLETAAIMLKRTEPQRVLIRGRVTVLSSSESPLSGAAQRSVVINWMSKDRPGPSKIIASIESPEDYQQALRSHEKWDIIEVSGYLQRYGNYWKLNDVQGFRVIL